MTDEMVAAADVVITMGCGDACPIYHGKRYQDWEVADPAGQPLEVVRASGTISAGGWRCCWRSCGWAAGLGRRGEFRLRSSLIEQLQKFERLSRAPLSMPKEKVNRPNTNSS
jgi:hypothetical protein